ncbi:MAG: hypothetical protein HRT35_14645 [Algicola sp.]|nr:hypothetical protein [Algicola sp.]
MKDLDGEMLEDLCELIARVAPEPIEREDITAATRFIEDLAMDSITLVALMFLCEEHFNIDVASQAEKIAELSTLGKTIEFIQQAPPLS